MSGDEEVLTDEKRRQTKRVKQKVRELSKWKLFCISRWDCLYLWTDWIYLSLKRDLNLFGQILGRCLSLLCWENSLQLRLSMSLDFSPPPVYFSFFAFCPSHNILVFKEEKHLQIFATKMPYLHFCATNQISKIECLALNLSVWIGSTLCVLWNSKKTS